MSILVLTSDTLIGTAAAGNLEYNGQFFGTDSNASRAQMQRIVRGTAVASTSGTSIDFTGIPAWAKRITVMFYGVSTNGSSAVRFRLGSGSVQTTGYISTSFSSSGAGPATAGFDQTSFASAGDVRYGFIAFLNISGNDWIADGGFTQGSTVIAQTTGGVALTGVLDLVRITTVNGTDTFDAGTINIMYEG